MIYFRQHKTYRLKGVAAMKEFTYIISDKEGIHARPAGLLVKEASQFSSTITIEKDGKTADLKRIFNLMSLTIKQNDTINIKVEGEDENEAVEAIEMFMKANL